jgi:hypothetical protein
VDLLDDVAEDVALSSPRQRAAIIVFDLVYAFALLRILGI